MVKLLLKNGSKDPYKYAWRKDCNEEITNLLRQKSKEDPQGFPYAEN